MLKPVCAFISMVRDCVAIERLKILSYPMSDIMLVTNGDKTTYNVCGLSCWEYKIPLSTPSLIGSILYSLLGSFDIWFGEGVVCGRI